MGGNVIGLKLFGRRPLNQFERTKFGFTCRKKSAEIRPSIGSPRPGCRGSSRRGGGKSQWRGANQARNSMSSPSRSPNPPAGVACWRTIRSLKGILKKQRLIRAPSARGTQSPRSEDSPVAKFRERLTISTNLHSWRCSRRWRNGSAGSRMGQGLRLSILRARETSYTLRCMAMDRLGRTQTRITGAPGIGVRLITRFRTKGQSHLP